MFTYFIIFKGKKNAGIPASLAMIIPEKLVYTNPLFFKTCRGNLLLPTGRIVIQLMYRTFLNKTMLRRDRHVSSTKAFYINPSTSEELSSYRFNTNGIA